MHVYHYCLNTWLDNYRVSNAKNQHHQNYILTSVTSWPTLNLNTGGVALDSVLASGRKSIEMPENPRLRGVTFGNLFLLPQIESSPFVCTQIITLKHC